MPYSVSKDTEACSAAKPWAVTKNATGELMGCHKTESDAQDQVEALYAADDRASDPKKPYGDVSYADPGYQKDKKKRYPVDTKEHAKAAWSYINQSDNASKYSADQLKAIKGRIKSALKKFGVEVSEENSIAPRESLTRSVPFEIVRTRSEDDGLTLEGYAAVFGSIARIDSWEGHFDEQIRRGAFSKSIGDKAQWPIMQFDHGQHPMIGSIPIGTITQLREDNRGLFVRARLTNSWLVEPVRQAIGEGAIKGMSFRFSVEREEWEKREDDVPLRTVTELRCSELGPVVWPAYKETTVGVRSKQVDELLRALTDKDIRREIAEALMLHSFEDDQTDAPLADQHPSDEPVRDDANDDAPLNEHPSEEIRDEDTETDSTDPARLRKWAETKAEYLKLIERNRHQYER